MIRKLISVFDDSTEVAVVIYTGGDNIFHDVANSNTATAILQIHSDGDVHKVEGATQTQLRSSTDWIRPSSGNDGLYEVRFTKDFFGDAPTGGDALGVWHFLSSNRSVSYVETSNNTQLTANITTQIRYNGGSVLDSGVNSMRAKVGNPI